MSAHVVEVVYTNGLSWQITVEAADEKAALKLARSKSEALGTDDVIDTVRLALPPYS